MGSATQNQTGVMNRPNPTIGGGPAGVGLVGGVRNALGLRDQALNPTNPVLGPPSIADIVGQVNANLQARQAALNAPGPASTPPPRWVPTSTPGPLSAPPVVSAPLPAPYGAQGPAAYGPPVNQQVGQAGNILASRDAALNAGPGGAPAPNIADIIRQIRALQAARRGP